MTPIVFIVEVLGPFVGGNRSSARTLGVELTGNVGLSW